MQYNNAFHKYIGRVEKSSKQKWHSFFCIFGGFVTALCELFVKERILLKFWNMSQSILHEYVILLNFFLLQKRWWVREKNQAKCAHFLPGLDYSAIFPCLFICVARNKIHHTKLQAHVNTTLHYLPFNHIDCCVKIIF